MWSQHEDGELQMVCGARPLHPVVGCAKPGPMTCQIYTLKVEKEKREELHETLGHELRHCFEGRWHK